MTVQYHSGSALVPASAVASEARRCWQLQGAGVVVVGPLAVVLGAQDVVAQHAPVVAGDAP